MRIKRIKCQVLRTMIGIARVPLLATTTLLPGYSQHPPRRTIHHGAHVQQILGVIIYKSESFCAWTLQIQQPFLLNKFEILGHSTKSWALRNTQI